MDDESARLLKEYVEGNSDAATEIYHKYIHRMIALARQRISPMLQHRVGPEDIAQSAMGSFYRKASDDQIVLKRSGDLWRVLAAFTVNKARKRIEQEMAEKRDPRLEVRGSVWVVAAIEGEPTADEVVCVIDQLQHYMGGLSPRDRLILELRLQGESIAEIAEELKQHAGQLGEEAAQTTEATIRRVLRDAKHKLRRMLFDE